jgi:drug/metabolite transporter (DMT)-like permease
MNFEWFFFALISPFLWAFTNVLDSAVRRNFIKNDYYMMWVSAFLRLPVILIIIAIYGLELPGFIPTIAMIFGGLLWTSMFIPYLRALNYEETSRVALFMQTIAIFTLLLGYLILGESLDPKQLIAFILILLGGTLAGVKQMQSKWHFSKAFWLILVASFFWSASDIIFKYFEADYASFINAFNLFLIGSFLTSIISLAIPSIRKEIKKVKTKEVPTKAWVIQVTSLIFAISGSMTFAYALTLGKVALTSVIIQTQPLFVLLIASTLAYIIPEIPKEDFSKKALLFKALSFATITFGLVVLYY